MSFGSVLQMRLSSPKKKERFDHVRRTNFALRRSGSACGHHPIALRTDGHQNKDPLDQEQTQFAPGVVTVIPPAPHPEETFDGPQTLQSLLDAHPEIQFGGDSHQERRATL